MTTELQTPGGSGKLFDVAPHLTEKQFNKLATSTAFLPRVQLFQSSSKLVKMGKFPQAHWGLVRKKDEAEDLGASFDCVIIQSRPKALDTSGKDVIQSLNVDSSEFQDIVDRSAEPDSGCMWGPEFLIWIPHSNTFATLFFSSATARNVAGEVEKLHGRGCTLGAQYIENKKKQSWHGPTVSMCSTPMTLPTQEMAMAENEKFIKVINKEVVADDDDDAEDERAR